MRAKRGFRKVSARGLVVYRSGCLERIDVEHAFVTRIVDGGGDRSFGGATDGRDVRDSYRAVARYLELEVGKIHRAKQVHGNTVAVITRDQTPETTCMTEADALVTRDFGHRCGGRHGRLCADSASGSTANGGRGTRGLARSCGGSDRRDHRDDARPRRSEGYPSRRRWPLYRPFSLCGEQRRCATLRIDNRRCLSRKQRRTTARQFGEGGMAATNSGWRSGDADRLRQHLYIRRSR